MAKTANQFSERRGYAVELLSKLPRYDVFSQNFCLQVPDWLPFFWSGGFTQTTGYTSLLPDLTDTKKLWLECLDAARWEIRKAQKQLKIVVSDDVDRLYDICHRTFEQQGRQHPVAEATIKRVVAGAVTAGKGRIAFAEDDKGNTHAGNFLVFDERSAHYNLGGSDKRYRSSGAASLLLWNSIEFAAQKSAVFDFEGSMVEGISRFFRSFNPELTPFLHVTGLSRRATVLSNMYNSGAALLGRRPLPL